MILRRCAFPLFLSAFFVFTLSAESKAFFGAKFEPPDGTAYHCAQAEVRPSKVNPFKLGVDWEGLEKYTAACSNRPKLIMHYITFDCIGLWLLKGKIKEIVEKEYDYIPQIGLDFYTYYPFKDITERIAEGSYDDRIVNLARFLKQLKHPVFLRPGYEFGGNGAGQFASKRFWISAWKRIVTLCKKEGAHNIAFVWNTLDAKDYMEYYPGDEFVDWWAINIFVNHANTNAFVNEFITEAAHHQKPVMIAESTPRYVGTERGELAWRSWFSPYFQLIQNYPHIKAFCYINATWSDFPDPTFQYDCLIQKNNYIKTRYCEELSRKSNKMSNGNSLP